MESYEHFLHTKRAIVKPIGIDVPAQELNSRLFGWQRDIVQWALRRGRAAIFSDCGTGKTVMELSWAEHVVHHTGQPVLMFAPLAVSQQTQREGRKFGIPVTVCRTQADVRPGINITNYEMLDHFKAEAFGGLVLDESGILKAFTGVTRKALTVFGSSISFRLAATATPAPNDLIELTNHAEFLDVLTGKEIIALYFMQDGNTTHKWRLKGHARQDFWRWLASWAVALRMPADLGYPNDGFILPALTVEQHTVEAPLSQETLFPLEALSLLERQRARKVSLSARVQAAADLVAAERSEYWLVWCDLNAESEALTRAIPGAVQITGSDSVEYKARALLDFQAGRTRVLVSKPSIAGHGMNLQLCARMIFVGLSDSWESWYQAVRRCWRFGQQRPVQVHVITSEQEGAVVRNIERKETQAAEMMTEIVGHMQGLQLDGALRDRVCDQTAEAHGANWTAYLGDAIEQIDRLESESVGLSVFSPPFPGMYAYTDSAHDLGNVTSIAQMIEHFRYLVTRDKLYRVLQPGRRVCVHLCQIAVMQSRDGYIGLRDFRGRVIKLFEDEGWIYFGEVTIDKNPQIQATRNKDRGLLFKSLATDSSVLRMALADYLIYFQKPGRNQEPIKAGVSARYNPRGGWITEEEWIEWAAPVWYRATKHYPGGIRETNVLNVRQAKETDDERHLCPLQRGVIERAVKLWSAPGDLVFSPFMGIGSEGVSALELGRRFAGIELKESYFQSAVENLRHAEQALHRPALFDLAEQASVATDLRAAG